MGVSKLRGFKSSTVPMDPCHWSGNGSTTLLYLDLDLLNLFFAVIKVPCIDDLSYAIVV